MATVDCTDKRELTDDEIAALPQPEPPTLEERKTAIWETVKAKREALTDSPGATVQTPVGEVQSDAKSQQKILGLVQMAVLANLNSQPFSEEFTLADNTTVTLDAAQMISLGVAVGENVADVYAHARTLRGEIEAAPDDAALDLIDRETGWP